MVTSDRLEQRYSLQSYSQPKYDYELYLDSHDNSYRVYRERSSGSDRQHNATNSKRWHRLHEDVCIQCKWRTDWNDSSLRSNILMVTSYRLEQCHSLQSYSQPKYNDDNLYFDGHDNSYRLYRE